MTLKPVKKLNGYTAQARWYAEFLTVAGTDDWRQVGWANLNGIVKPVYRLMKATAGPNLSWFARDTFVAVMGVGTGTLKCQVVAVPTTAVCENEQDVTR